MTGKMIEFPPGSGRTAFYAPAERKMMRAVLDAAESAGEPVVPQMRALHDLKVEFGIDLVLDQRELGRPDAGDVVVGGDRG